MRPVLTAIVLAACLAAGPVLAQATPPASGPGGMGAGPGPGGTADRTGAITATGQTKPPGDALGPQDGTNSRLQERSRELDQKIQTGICTGCK